MNKIKATTLLLLALLLLMPIGSAQAQRRKKSTKQPNPNLTHYVGGYGALGYSNLMHDIDMTSSLGGATGAVGFEYLLQYKKCFSFSVGVEGMLFNSFTKIDPFDYKANFEYKDNISGTTQMEYVMRFNNYLEGDNKFSVNLPIMLGAQFGKFFFMVGAKAEANLAGFYSVNAPVKAWVYDPELIDNLASMPSHNISDFKVNTNGNKLDWGGVAGILDVAVSAEVGLVLDDWMPSTWLTIGRGKKARTASYRLSLFADYGLPMININYNDYRNNGQPSEDPMLVFGEMGVNMTQVSGGWQVDMEAREKLNPNSIIASNKGVNADGGLAMLNNLVVGAKFAMLIDVTPKPKPVRRPPKKRPQPKTVTVSPDPPFFYCVITDAETQLPLDAQVVLYRLNEQQTPIHSDITDSVSGFTQYQLTPAQRNASYGLKVEREGYFAYNDTLNQILGDTIFVEMSPIKIDVPIILKNLHFDTDKAVIKNTSAQSLEDMYQMLVDRPNIEIEISGHTDNVGKDGYNKKLSERRAKAVYEEMVKRGIDPRRMTYKGMGNREPIDTNDTEEGRANNRRVEFKITNEK